MFDDELQPQKQKPKPRDLAPLSVEELHQLIDDFRAEIARAEAEIARKKAVAEAAASFFKKS